MQKTVTKSVPYFEHPSIKTTPELNWEDLRVFLCVARRLSFRASAQDLGLSFNTVRRHVERLERVTGSRVMARHPRGIELTEEGRTLFEAARSMEATAVEVNRLSRRSPSKDAGRVRITITEGLGTFWLISKLARFQRSYPMLVLEVNCSFREPDVMRMETDISIQLAPPRHADLKSVKLGRMHVMPYASTDYLKTYGTPASFADVANHKVVEQLSPQLDVSAIDRLFPGKPREGFVSIVTNTSTAHFWAVAGGGGIGVLPTYLTALGAAVVPVDIGFVMSHEIQMAYHAEARKTRRMALALDFIKEAFDKNRYPWFGNEFIHPRDFATLAKPASDDGHFFADLTT
jgi:DNA-binding transcriptional LysR family regulator